jgi:hypothetical protein
LKVGGLTPKGPQLCFSKNIEKLPPCRPKKGYEKKVIWSGISMGICGKNFKKIDCIDFKIITFEERRKCFFIPCPAGSVDFDSRWHEKLELHKVEVLEIHNVWNVRFLWKNP